MGDVAFHLKAITSGKIVSLFYDSVLSVSNVDKSAQRGEIRIATRESAFAEDWKYQSVPQGGGNTVVAGYDLAATQISKVTYLGWLGASGISLPKPDQIQWSKVDVTASPSTSKTDYFGTPSAPIAVDNASVIFGCQDRLCSYNKNDQTFNLISSASIKDAKAAAWITINKVKYALVASAGKLTLFRKP
jgi:hypothetical protein